MAFELRKVTFQVSNPRETVGLVSFFAGEASEPEQLGQWISGQVISEDIPPEPVTICVWSV